MIGKKLVKLRKDKNITQEVMANELGVTRQTISNWESGITSPNVEQLSKISNFFNINLNELIIDDKYKSKGLTIKKKIIITMIIIIILIFLSTKFLFVKEDSDINELDKDCTLIRTYNIVNIDNSNDENYNYITVKEYQVEGVFSVKVSKLISKDIEVNNNYEFTFNINKNYLNADTEVIFEKSDILNIIKTEKIGMEQSNSVNCK